MFTAILSSLVLTQAAPLEDPAEAFGSLPLFSGLEVSPDGSRLAALVRTQGQQGLGIFTADDGVQFQHFLRDEDDKKLRDFFWKSDKFLVFSAQLPGSRYGTRTVETRLFSIEVGPGDVTPLLEKARPRDRMPVQIQDNFVSLLPSDPQNILVQFRELGDADYSVYRINVENNRRPSLVQRSVNDSVSFLADQTGEVRYSFGIRSDVEQRISLKLPNNRWRDFSARVAEGQPSFRVVGFPNDRRFAYVLSDHESDTRALYRFNIEEDAFEEQLFSHPTSDVLGIRQDPDTGEAIAAFYADDDSSVVWFKDNRPRQTAIAVQEAMGLDRLSFIRYNLSRSHAVLFGGNGIRPGRFFTFDYGTGQVLELPSQYPSLERVALGEVVATSYEARDGLDIPAFVTLPPGNASLSDVESLPFIVLPHGGPTARDLRGFDWLAQFLAHKGFGVLQMNFRGSSGYGAEFQAAGDREWGQAMQDDITDGTNWLFENGWADPSRTSILGASYGGYAALMGVVREPELFRCAVSINGVTDLPKVLSDARDYVGGEFGTRHIGRLWRDRRMLRENSPSQRIEDIQTPILLIASEEDRTVPKEHSLMMRRRLERAGKDVEFVLLPEGSHQLNVNDNRVTALRAIDDFLADCR